ncbi:MAG TPA: rod shape-determining protein MreD [Patescibacteria group bacterium]|nr:rod shape-determining protein MreD [Patescibacteria group bacterium]
MFRKGVIFLVILLAASLQVSAMVNFFPNWAVPDVMLVLVVIWTAKDGFEKTLSRTIAIGVISDLISYLPVGENVVGLSVVSYLVGYSARRFLVSQQAWKLLFLVTIVIFATIANQVINFIIFTLVTLTEKKELLSAHILFNSGIIYKIIANIIILFVIYWPIKKIEQFLAVYNRDPIVNKK